MSAAAAARHTDPCEAFRAFRIYISALMVLGGSAYGYYWLKLDAYEKAGRETDKQIVALSTDMKYALADLAEIKAALRNQQAAALTIP